MSVIYLIKNLVSGKIYVGKTTCTLNSRWRRHVRDSRNPVSKLHCAINKYGASNFQMSILEITDTPAEREKTWIQRLDAMNPRVGYNMTPGGDGGDMSKSERFRRAMMIRDYKGSRNPNFGKTSPMRNKAQAASFCEATSQGLAASWASSTIEDRRARASKISGSANGMFGKKPAPIVPVTIAGVTYSSKAAAMRALNIRGVAFKRMLVSQ